MHQEIALGEKQLLGAPLQVNGAQEIVTTPAGFVARRLPAWTKPLLPAELNRVVQMPAGVRICFETDADTLSVETQLGFVYTLPRSPPVAAMDLEIDGEVRTIRQRKGDHWLLDSRAPSGFRFKPGPSAIFHFTNLGSGRKRCTIWLPHNVMVEVRGLQTNPGATIWPARRLKRPSWLHYGSSTSQCMEAKKPTATWPVIAARSADVHLYNFSFAGQCHMDQFVARSIATQPVDLISLKLGINIVTGGSLSRRTFAPALHGLIDTIRDKQPDTPVLLISPIHRSNGIFPAPRRWGTLRSVLRRSGRRESERDLLSLEIVRETVEEIAALRTAQGDAHIEFLNGHDLFGPADGHQLLDGIHPGADGYQIIGTRFGELLQRRFSPSSPKAPGAHPEDELALTA